MHRRRFIVWVSVIGLFMSTSGCVADGDSPSKATGTSVETSTPSVTPTTPPTTVAVTTTTAPRVATLTASPIPDGTDVLEAHHISAVLGSGLNGPTSLMVGASASKPGEAMRAAAWTTTDAIQWAAASLDDSAAAESTADAVTAIDGLTVIAGSAVIAGSSRVLLWTSVDGAVFGAPEVLIADRPGVAEAAVFVGSDVLVAARVDVGGTTALVIARRSADGVVSISDVAADAPVSDIVGMAARENTVVITGSLKTAEATRPVVWTSTDAGRTFTQLDPTAGVHGSFGIPSVTPNGFVMPAVSPAQDNLDVVSSVDGITWGNAPVAVSETEGVETTSLFLNQPRNLVGYGDGFAVGTVDFQSHVVFTDGKGAGSQTLLPFEWSYEIVDQPVLVFVAADTLMAVTNSGAGVRLAQYADDRWTTVSVAGMAARLRPLPSKVRLGSISTGPTADVTVYPEVTSDGGRYSWGEGQTLSTRVASAEWQIDTSAPAGMRDFRVFSDGANDFGIGFARSGASLDTDYQSTLWRRQADGGWGDSQLTVAGAIADVARREEGWLLVGSMFGVGDAPDRAPLMKRGDGMTWTDVAVTGMPVNAGLSMIVGGPGGPQVVLGYQPNPVFRAAPLRTIVLGVQPDASWAPIDMPEGPIGPVVAHTTLNGALLLLASEGREYLLYRSSDGRTFTVEPVALPEGPAATVSGLVVVDGRLIATGSVASGMTTQLAMWTLDGSAWTRVVIENPPIAYDLTVDDAIVESDGTLLVGGIFHRQATAWSIDTTAIG